MVDITAMLQAATNPAGIDVLLALANKQGVLSTDGYEDVSLANAGTGGVSFYRTLKAPAAKAVAAVTDDQDVIAHIYNKDRRKHVRRSLGHNPHLPANLVQAIMDDPEDPAEETVRTRSRAELSELLQRPAGERSPYDMERVFAEATLDELEKYCREGAGNLHRVDLPGILRGGQFLTNVDKLELVHSSLFSYPNSVTWDWGLWEPFVLSLGEDAGGDDEVGLLPLVRRHGTFTPAPADWLRKMLQTTKHRAFRRLALAVTDPGVVMRSPDIREMLTDKEWETLGSHPMGLPFSSEYAREQLDRLRAKSEIDSRGATNAALAFTARLITPEPRRYRGPYSAMPGRYLLDANELEEVLLLGLGAAGPEHILRCVRVALLPYGESSDAFRDRVADHLRERRLPSIALRDLIEQADPRALTEHQLAFARIGSLSSIDPSLSPKLLVQEFERLLPNAGEAEWQLLLDLVDDWTGDTQDLLDTISAST